MQFSGFDPQKSYASCRKIPAGHIRHMANPTVPLCHSILFQDFFKCIISEHQKPLNENILLGKCSTKFSVREWFVKAPNFSRSSAKLAAQCNGSIFFLAPFETRFMFRCVIFATRILILGKHHVPKHPEHGEIKKAEWKCWVFSPWMNTVNQKCYGRWRLKADDMRWRLVSFSVVVCEM